MNIIAITRERAPEFAANPAIIEGGETWTHAELWDRVDRLSQALLGPGEVGKGDVVMAWLPNSHEAIEAELACLQIGAVWVSLNTRMTWPEVAGVMASTAPSLLITDAERLAKMGEAGPDDGGAAFPKRILIAGKADEVDASKDAAPDTASHLSYYEDAIKAAASEQPANEIEPEDIARLRHTSGTTGDARAAVLPHRVYIASLDNLRTELHPLDSTDRVLHAAPITHASGAMIYPILAAGGANVLHDRFDAERVLESIERDRITTMFIVPTMLQRLIASPSFKTRDLSSMKTMMYGGAPMAVEQLEPAIERFGTALVHIYGMTEAPYPITTLKREEHYVGNPRLGSIGKSTTVCEVRIVDDAGREVTGDEVGELCVRGRNVMRGYWNDEAETKRLMTDGWLATGDLARRDSEGYLFIVDRKKDVIISGGFNVYAKEVELTLCRYEGVAEAAAVGIPHPDWGEMVAAFVVPTAGAQLDPAEIERWCRTQLSGYKCPKRIEIVAELPKNSSGKVMKKALVGISTGRASVSE